MEMIYSLQGGNLQVSSRNTAIDNIQVNSYLLVLRKLHLINFPIFGVEIWNDACVSSLIARVVNGNNYYTVCDLQVPLRKTD